MKNKYNDNNFELKQITKKGSNCSKSGNAYEKKVYDVISNVLFNGKKFNTQQSNQLGGLRANIDIACNHKKENDIGIEIKKSKYTRLVSMFISI